MNPSSVMRWAAAFAALATSAATLAQAPVFVTVETQALQVAPAAAGRNGRIGQGIERAAPVVMETEGHLNADGSISTSCAAIPSDVPHSVSAAHAITKQQER